MDRRVSLTAVGIAGLLLETCAVRAWNARTAAAAITTRPAFRSVDHHNRLLHDGLSPEAVDQALI